MQITWNTESKSLVIVNASMVEQEGLASLASDGVGFGDINLTYSETSIDILIEAISNDRLLAFVKFCELSIAQVKD